MIKVAANGIKAVKAAGIYGVGFDSLHSKNQDCSQADKVISSFEEIVFKTLC